MQLTPLQLDEALSIIEFLANNETSYTSNACGDNDALRCNWCDACVDTHHHGNHYYRCESHKEDCLMLRAERLITELKGTI
jgi:hypothetical protein